MVTTHSTANKTVKATRSKKAAPDAAQAANQTLLQLLIATPVQLLPYSRLSSTDLNVRRIPFQNTERWKNWQTVLRPWGYSRT